MSFGSSLANGTVSNAGGALEVVVAFSLPPVGEMVAVEGTLDTTEVEFPAVGAVLASEARTMAQKTEEKRRFMLERCLTAVVLA